MSISVLVADDEALIRAGIVMMLERHHDVTVVGEAANGAQAVELARALRPDVVLMDLRMPVMDGEAATRQLCAESSDTPQLPLVKVLVLTTFEDDDAVYGALLAGASGYLLKHAAPQDLISAVRHVAAGEAWIDPSVAGRVIKALANLPRAGQSDSELCARLTPREQEVLVLMAHGLSNGEIGQRLVVGAGTVKTHISRILMKTASRDRSQAIALAYQSGLVSGRR
ncbi:MAG: response regulator transcription factor [Propionibacteriaceae bacterium]